MAKLARRHRIIRWNPPSNNDLDRKIYTGLVVTGAIAAGAIVLPGVVMFTIMSINALSGHPTSAAGL